MAKKVDTSFMKIVSNDAEWTREIEEASGKVMCSKSARCRRLSPFPYFCLHHDDGLQMLTMQRCDACLQSLTCTRGHGAHAR